MRELHFNSVLQCVIGYGTTLYLVMYKDKEHFNNAGIAPDSDFDRK